VLAAIASAAVMLSACGGTQGGCTPTLNQKYPAVTLAVPISGATNVSTNIGTIVVSTSGPQLFGTLSLVSPSGTVELAATPSVGPGPGNHFSATLPSLFPDTEYSVVYTLQYPGSCQLSPTVVHEPVGSFTTGQ
jgi:hypothetical protein